MESQKLPRCAVKALTACHMLAYAGEDQLEAARQTAKAAIDLMVEDMSEGKLHVQLLKEGMEVESLCVSDQSGS